MYTSIEGRAGRRSWGTIILSREGTELSRTIPSFRKKNERIERVFKILEQLVKERRGTNENCLKKTLKSGMRSHYQDKNKLFRFIKIK